MTFFESVSKVLPVIFLFLPGMLLNRRQFMRPDTMADLKNLVIKITLPAALFLAFSRASLVPRHLIIVGVMFGVCVLVTCSLNSATNALRESTAHTTVGH